MAKTEKMEAQFTLFLHFQAAYPEQARAMEPGLTRAQRAGHEPLHPSDAAFLESLVLRDLNDDEDDEC